MILQGEHRKIAVLAFGFFMALLALRWLWEYNQPLFVIFALGGAILLAYECYERSWRDQIRRAAPVMIDPLTEGMKPKCDMPEESSALGSLLMAMIYGSIPFGLSFVFI